MSIIILISLTEKLKSPLCFSISSYKLIILRINQLYYQHEVKVRMRQKKKTALSKINEKRNIKGLIVILLNAVFFLLNAVFFFFT